MRRLECLYRSDLPSRAIVVYMYLADRAGQKGFCYPGIPRIARDTGLSVNTVRRAIQDLKRTGFVLVDERSRSNGADSSNLYTLTNLESAW